MGAGGFGLGVDAEGTALGSGVGRGIQQVQSNAEVIVLLQEIDVLLQEIDRGSAARNRS